MLKRRFTLPPEHLYPAEEWRIVETRYSDEYVGRAETAFALGNGFLGVRGTFEEGRPAVSPGTYVNGLRLSGPTQLVAGDEIRMCDRQFIFMTRKRGDSP